MKTKNYQRICAFMAISFLSTFAVFAEDKAAPPAVTAQEHNAHHPEAASKTANMGDGMMMGSMKMEDMKEMMDGCMEMHKDGKMCGQEAMTKCQENMKKGQCQNMMKQVKMKK